MNLIYYKELNGVRGIAALMVMFLHFFGQGIYKATAWPPLIKFSSIGQTGVDLFFVLSGFLITRILLETREQKGYFKKFYFRRSIRIFPLYFAFLTFTYFLLPFLTNTNLPSLSEQIYHLVYLQNFAMTFEWNYIGPEHFWSLAVEEHFYLFWPLLVYFLNQRQLLIAIILIVFIAFVTRVFLVDAGYESYYLTFARMDILALGALIALAEKNKLFGRIKPIKLLYLSILLLLPTLALFLHFGGEGNNIIQVIKPLLIGLFFLVGITYIILLKEQNILKRLLCSRPLNFTGKVSYGLYVYHPVCFGFYYTYFQSSNMIINLLGSFLLSYFISVLSFYIFESKILKLKQYFEYSKGQKNQVQKAVA